MCRRMGASRPGVSGGAITARAAAWVSGDGSTWTRADDTPTWTSGRAWTRSRNRVAAACSASARTGKASWPSAPFERVRPATPCGRRHGHPGWSDVDPIGHWSSGLRRTADGRREGPTGPWPSARCASPIARSGRRRRRRRRRRTGRPGTPRHVVGSAARRPSPRRAARSSRSACGTRTRAVRAPGLAERGRRRLGPDE